MIKEELRKEIEKEAKRRTRGFRNQENCIQSYIMGASDFAEPREKRIAELEQELAEYKEVFGSCETCKRTCDIDNAIQQANKGLDLDKIADEMKQDLKDSEVEK
jgi:hypothetical protein